MPEGNNRARTITDGEDYLVYLPTLLLGDGYGYFLDVSDLNSKFFESGAREGGFSMADHLTISTEFDLSSKCEPLSGWCCSRSSIPR
jgi:hypothetical protein